MWAGIGTNLRFFLITAALACISHFSFGQFYVGGKLCRSMPPPNIDGNGIPSTSDCNEPTIFFDEDPTSTAWLWDFGDGNTSTLRNPSHLYASTGNYTVTLTRTKGGVQQTPVTKPIIISEPPAQPKFYKQISNEKTVCDGKTLKLDPYDVLEGGSPAPAGVKYLWFPNGETTPTIDVTKSGCYSVEVFDASGQCSRTAKINVKFCMQPAGGGGNEKWYFGKGATLEFGINPTSVIPRDTLANDGDLFEQPDSDVPPVFIPVPPTQSNPIDSPEGVAMVFDPKGEIVLYTDGVKLYGKNDLELPGGTLPGTNTSTQSALIVPKSNCNECPHHLYYVYTMNETTGRLSYSIVDMRRNGGQGEIVEKDIPVSLSSTEQIVGKKVEDEKSIAFFVYSQDKTTGQFKILKIDSTGTTQINQPLMPISQIPDESGYMKISPNGRKLATAYVKDGKNYIEIYNIDITTGVLTFADSVHLGAAPPTVYGVEFSQDGEKLYTTLRGGAGVKSYLYQLNLKLSPSDNIGQQKKKIAESNDVFGALQMGPTNSGTGGYIYMAVEGSKEIAYIGQPNTLITNNTNAAAEVNYLSFTHPDAPNVLGTSQLGFPNVLHAKKQQDGDGPAAKYEGTCQNLPTKFSTEGVCSPLISEISWEFGDGEKAKGKTVSHTYKKPGRYIVTMIVEVYAETAISKIINIPLFGNLFKEKCNVYPITDTIYIKPSPIINLADSAYACFKDQYTLVLDPKAQNLYNPEYLWKPRQPFETTPTITVDAVTSSGYYSVDIKNNFQSQSGEIYSCAAEDEILVRDKCDPRLFLPQAFSPNGDGVNDQLKIHYKYITDFDLKIYNRWGEIIFESFDPEKMWDGRYKGQVMAPMMYAYVVSYKSEEFPDRPKITKTGGILLVK